MIASFGVGQVFFSLIWFFLFVTWIMLVFRVFGDIFRDTEASGGAKVFWILFVIVFPFIGVFTYLISRGDKMAAREVKALEAQEQAARQYLREAVGTSGAEELHRLVELKEKGVINDDEFARMKARIVE